MPIDLRTLGSKLAKYRGQLKETVVEDASSTGIDAARAYHFNGTVSILVRIAGKLALEGVGQVPWRIMLGKQITQRGRWRLG